MTTDNLYIYIFQLRWLFKSVSRVDQIMPHVRKRLNTGQIRSMEIKSVQHADLLLEMEYRTAIPYIENAPAAAEQEVKNYMTHGWFFLDLQSCFEREPIIYYAMRSTRLWDFSNTAMFFITAIVVHMRQFVVTTETFANYVRGSLFCELPTLSSHYTYTDRIFHLLLPFIPERADAPEIAFSFRTKMHSPFQHIVQMTMMMVLMRKHGVDENKRYAHQTLVDIVSDIYIECMTMIYTVSPGLHMPGTKSVDSLKLPTTENRPNFVHGNQLIHGVTIWFENFLLKRMFCRGYYQTLITSAYGPRIMEIHKLRDSPIHQYFEKAVDNTTGIFHMCEFLKQYRINVDCQQIIDGTNVHALKLQDFLDQDTKTSLFYVSSSDPSRNENYLLKMRGLTYTVDMEAIARLLLMIYKWIDIDFHQFPKDPRYTKCLFGDHSRPKFRGLQSFYLFLVYKKKHVFEHDHPLALVVMDPALAPAPEPVADPNTNVKIDEIVRLLGEGEHDPADIKHLLKELCRIFQGFKTGYKAYMTRYTGDRNARTHSPFMNDIKKFMGVFVKRNTDRLPSNVVDILSNLQAEVSCPTASGALVHMLCVDYERKFQTQGTFAGPEVGVEKLQYWTNWKDKLYFFLSLMLHSLNVGTDNSGLIIKHNTNWLNQQYSAPEIPEIIADWRSFDDGEHRRYLHPYTCLCLFAELFPCKLARELVERKWYTIAHLLYCIQVNGKPFPSFTMFPIFQNDTFKWTRHFHNTPIDHKFLVEHVLCVLMTLMRVNQIHVDVLYNNICPPGDTLIKEAIRIKEIEENEGRRAEVARMIAAAEAAAEAQRLAEEAAAAEVQRLTEEAEAAELLRVAAEAAAADARRAAEEAEAAEARRAAEEAEAAEARRAAEETEAAEARRAAEETEAAEARRAAEEAAAATEEIGRAHV